MTEVVYLLISLLLVAACGAFVAAAFALVTVGGGALDAGPVDRDERELGCDEEATGGHEGQRDEEQQEGGHDAHPEVSAVVRGL